MEWPKVVGELGGRWLLEALRKSRLLAVGVGLTLYRILRPHSREAWALRPPGSLDPCRAE